MLEQVILRARECGAAAPAVPVKDTLKQAKDGVVTATPDRASLYAVQTPQVFEAALIRTALTKALEEGASLTDALFCRGTAGRRGCPDPGRLSEHQDHHP